MNIIFSYDAEGNWGCVDWDKPYLNEDKAEELSDAYTQLVDLHARYNVPATFGFVGLYAATEEDRDKIISRDYSEFIDKYPNLELTEGCWNGHANFQKVNAKKKLFEIASHSMSHLPFNEIDATQVTKEFDSSQKLLSEYAQQEVTSFIYPRNFIRQTDEVSDYFSVYRNTPANKKYQRIADLLRTMTGRELFVGKEVSEFLFWKGGARERLSDNNWKNLWEKRLNAPKQNTKTYHVWSHPHNFVTDSTLLNRLEWLFKAIQDSSQSVSLKFLKQI